MARKYSIDGQDTNTNATTIIALYSAATIRPSVYDIILYSDATADNAVEYNFQRVTSVGTYTAVTPQALRSDDPAALGSAGEAHSAEPGYTANAVMLNIGGNERSTIRWVAVPGGEIVLPASAANGIGQQAISPTTGFNCVTTIHYEE